MSTQATWSIQRTQSSCPSEYKGPGPNLSKEITFYKRTCMPSDHILPQYVGYERQFCAEGENWVVKISRNKWTGSRDKGSGLFLISSTFLDCWHCIWNWVRCWIIRSARRYRFKEESRTVLDLGRWPSSGRQLEKGFLAPEHRKLCSMRLYCIFSSYSPLLGIWNWKQRSRN